MCETKQAFISTVIGMIMVFIIGLLTFFRTGFIVKYINSDVNAVTQLARQIFTYLVLLESGLATAYTYKMYKPLSIEDYSKVNSLFKGLHNTLKKIAVKMFLGIMIIALIYPLMIKKNILNYIDIVFLLLLLGTRFILPYYLYVSKKNLLITTSKKYIVELLDGILNISILIFEIILIMLKVPIIIIFSLSLIFYFIINKVYDYILRKHCYTIIVNNSRPSYEASDMTKDIIVHQISSLVFSSTDSILLSIFKSLNDVTIYNAYDNLLSYPTLIINKFSSAISASFGLKLANNKNNTYEIYNEVLNVIIFIDIIITSLFFLFANQFVTLWLGKEYIIDNFSLILFSLLLAHRITMPIVYIIRNGKGMYKETKKYTLMQAIVNLLLSILFIIPFGIPGILLATVLSTYFILEPSNYKIVYHDIFHKKMVIYFDLLKTMVTIIVCISICSKFLLTKNLTWSIFFINVLISLFISTTIAFIVQYISSKYFRKSLLRLKK